MKNLISLTPKSSVWYTLIFCFVCFLAVNEVKAQQQLDIYYPDLQNPTLAKFILEEDLIVLEDAFESIDVNHIDYNSIRKEFLLNLHVFEDITLGSGVAQALTRVFLEFAPEFDMNVDQFVLFEIKDNDKVYPDSYGDEVFDQLVEKLK